MEQEKLRAAEKNKSALMSFFSLQKSLVSFASGISLAPDPLGTQPHSPRPTSVALVRSKKESRLACHVPLQGAEKATEFAALQALLNQLRTAKPTFNTYIEETKKNFLASLS